MNISGILLHNQENRMVLYIFVILKPDKLNFSFKSLCILNK